MTEQLSGAMQVPAGAVPSVWSGAGFPQVPWAVSGVVQVPLRYPGQCLERCRYPSGTLARIWSCAGTPQVPGQCQEWCKYPAGAEWCRNWPTEPMCLTVSQGVSIPACTLAPH